MTCLLLYAGVRDPVCLIYAGLFDIIVSTIIAASFCINEPEEQP